MNKQINEGVFVSKDSIFGQTSGFCTMSRTVCLRTQCETIFGKKQVPMLKHHQNSPNMTICAFVTFQKLKLSQKIYHFEPLQYTSQVVSYLTLYCGI
jgi:hypothetical protein